MKTIRWIHLLFSVIVSVTIYFLSCNYPNKSDLNDPIINYKVYLMGKVLNKDGNPVRFAIAHLKNYDVLDTTDNNGIYEVTVDLDNLIKTEKTTAYTNDTLQILKDGQIITAFEIINFIDTLPDVFIEQRDIGGTIASTVKQFSKIEAVVWNHSDTILKRAELEYSLPTFSYSGFFYVIYTGTTQNYSVYVNVYSIDSLFIGRSDTIHFTSMAGDIRIPVIDPQNAIPVPYASTDSVVSINDLLHLEGTATDVYGIIVKWEWDAGNTGVFSETTPDSNFIAIAPSASNSTYQCVLKVTDNDGNIALDTVAVNVLTDAPIPTGSTTTPTVSINDTIRLQGTATDVYGRIVKWEWDAGNTGTFVETTPDSNFTAIAPPSQNLNYHYVLRVTDDDDNVAKDTVFISIFGQVIDIDGNVYHTVNIGNQEWTVENLRTTRYNDGTPVTKIEDNTAWSSDTSGAYCCYGNDSAANAAKYGALYNWHAVNTGKLAPEGWHVPTDEEWKELENYLIANGYNWDGTTIGNKIGKSMAAKTDWEPSDVAGSPGNDLPSNNSSGFSALPGGYRYSSGLFYYQDSHGGWWSSNEGDASGAYGRRLCNDNDALDRSYDKKEFGFSVRLLRNY